MFMIHTIEQFMSIRLAEVYHMYHHHKWLHYIEQFKASRLVRYYAASSLTYPDFDVILS